MAGQLLPSPLGCFPLFSRRSRLRCVGLSGGTCSASSGWLSTCAQPLLACAPRWPPSSGWSWSGETSWTHGPCSAAAAGCRAASRSRCRPARRAMRPGWQRATRGGAPPPPLRTRAYRRRARGTAQPWTHTWRRPTRDACAAARRERRARMRRARRLRRRLTAALPPSGWTLAASAATPGLSIGCPRSSLPSSWAPTPSPLPTTARSGTLGGWCWKPGTRVGLAAPARAAGVP